MSYPAKDKNRNRGGVAMKYYTSTTEFNCGIDLHGREMYVCLVDREGNKLVHTNIKGNDFGFFLKKVAPYRHSLTVCCECTFNWYWLSDACEDAGMIFVLAHALYTRNNWKGYTASSKAMPFSPINWRGRSIICSRMGPPLIWKD
jgi:hypothetical protein